VVVWNGCVTFHRVDRMANIGHGNNPKVQDKRMLN
jgi:hypothetical protein